MAEESAAMRSPEPAVASAPTSGPAARREDRKGGISQAVFNFVNSIIGAGIISLPFALREAGLGVGIALLVGMALLSYYSVTLLVRLGVAARTLNYEMLAGAALGRCGFVTVVVSQFLFAYGAMVAYLIITGDTLSVVIAHWAGLAAIDPWLRAGVILGAAVLVVLPLSCVRDMASLGWSSLASLTAVAWIVAFVLAQARPDGDTVPIEPIVDGDRVWGAVSIVAFAFVCHHSSTLVYNSLRDPEGGRWAVTARVSILIAGALSVALGLGGVVRFGSGVKANLLNSFSSRDELANATRVLFAATMVLTYPLEMYVSRHCLFILGAAVGPGPAGGGAVALDAASLPWWRHALLTVALWATSVAIAAAVEDLGIVLELTGGVSAVFVGFIMPALIHLSLLAPASFARLPACCRGRLSGLRADGTIAQVGDAASLAEAAASGEEAGLELVAMPSATAAPVEGGEGAPGAAASAGKAAASAAAPAPAEAAPEAAAAPWRRPLCEALPTLFLLAFGCVALVASTVTAVLSALSGGSGGGSAEV